MNMAEKNTLPVSLSAVLFDLDDTLLDSFAARVRAVQDAFQQTGLKRINAEEYLRNLGGKQLNEAFVTLQVEEGRDLKLLDRYRRAYWHKERGSIRLYPAVEETLRTLYDRGVNLGVVTQKGGKFDLDGRGVGAWRELEDMGVFDLFSALVGFEDVTRYKPDPEGVNIALERLGAPPHETLLVGDSGADIAAAQAAGCWSCHAIWGIPVSEHSLAPVKPDMVARTPEVLLGLEYTPRASEIIQTRRS